ncbi:nuclear transport factor 2 family protein [Pseudoflavitalea sp. G-6-1-2]|uniref:nuclear transport factor 2 family protein n=1 Tax=Pseudoflavitalea sp. G-6-1-2 TaxID=2728841 RepID=UPI00146ABC2C|nr:nuclear transport factor 2 family protein [Pseudoflavitalea sp. G-6-1-2]NML23021.1 nuclear transport factor 2 family protein [Pseudoflavitalea sp. G-6-1-2]
MSQQAVIETFMQWDRSIVQNDATAISTFITDDWVIAGSNGITTKAAFLSDIESGKLTHHRMDSDEYHVILHGSTAVVISKGTSAGTYDGQPFSLYEWSASTFVQINGKWLCCVTMLTPAA